MRFWLAILLISISLSCWGAELVIPRISNPVELENFSGMQPDASLAGQFAVIQDFVQSTPNDGAAPSQKTVVYVAYDQNYLYVIFVCFDKNPERIAASISRRESFSEDEDWVEFYLDTFNDQRRAYCFSTNALGVQWDSRYSETTASGGFRAHQPSFDALWYSRAKLTDQGYVSWMKIPFKSIRFPSRDLQTWRILFGRSIPRTNEYNAWPHMSQSVQGYLTQSSLLTGLQRISPGRSMQFIPYTSFRSFRLLDANAPEPHFLEDPADASVGLDAKLVFKDSFVFDVALNPDFSQVESDQPQVTVNQRFEVFFREKRPFFLENGQYFETPLNLVFTRRIADPKYGGRFTGKYGAYTLGMMISDDEAPGKIVPEDSPLFGTDAAFGILRVSRDISTQSSIGLLYTGRSFEGTSNQVAGADFKLRLNDQWQASGQVAGSWTNPVSGRQQNGESYFATIIRSGENFGMQTTYTDHSPDFVTLTGFIPRVDFREINGQTHYYFRPAGKTLVAYGPEFTVAQSWDYNGIRLDTSILPGLYLELQRRTYFHVNYLFGKQQLRPVDFPVLSENQLFDTPLWHLDFSSSYWKWGTMTLQYENGKGINFVPVEGAAPERADQESVSAEMRVRPFRRWQLNTQYLFTALTAENGPDIFNDHIISVRSNFQFTREFSLRLILQYESTIVNPSLTSLEDRRNFNADVLFTYLVNPWTALYVGYNGNQQNYEFFPDADPSVVIRRRGVFLNDANQFFVKFSYLLRL